MTLTATHTIYGVEAGTGSLIGAITKQNIALQSQIDGEVTDGEIYRRFLALREQKVAPGFSTLAIASALGSIPVIGKSLADMTGGLDFFAQKNLDGGTRASGANHRQFTFTKGIAVPRRLSVDHRGNASLDYEIVVVYDGSNAPIVITDSVALPTGLLGQSERFTMAGMTLGGVVIPAKTRWSIEFGLDAIGEGADSDIYDTFAHIRTVQTELKIESLDVSLVAAAKIPLLGKVATHATSTIYLRKRASGGTGFVADGSASHIALTCDGLVVPEECFSGDGQTSGKVNLQVPLRYDGSNAPLIISTAATIS